MIERLHAALVDQAHLHADHRMRRALVGRMIAMSHRASVLLARLQRIGAVDRRDTHVRTL